MSNSIDLCNGARTEFGHSIVECVDLVNINGCNNGSQFISPTISPSAYGALLSSHLGAVTGTYIKWIQESRKDFCDTCFASASKTVASDCSSCKMVTEIVPHHTDCDDVTLDHARDEYLAKSPETLIRLSQEWPMVPVTAEDFLNSLKSGVVAGSSDLLRIPLQETDGKTWLAVYSIAKRELATVLSHALGNILTAQSIVKVVDGKRRKFVRISFEGFTCDLDTFDTVLLWINATRVLQGLVPFKVLISFWEATSLYEALNETYDHLARFMAYQKARRSKHVRRLKETTAALVEVETDKINAEAGACIDTFKKHPKGTPKDEILSYRANAQNRIGRFRNVPKTIVGVEREKKRLIALAIEKFSVRCAPWNSFIKSHRIVARGLNLVHRHVKLIVSFCESHSDIFKETVRARKEAVRFAKETADRVAEVAAREVAKEAALKKAENERISLERSSQPMTSESDSNWRGRLVDTSVATTKPTGNSKPQPQPQAQVQARASGSSGNAWRRERQEPVQEPRRVASRTNTDNWRREEPRRSSGSGSASASGDWRRSSTSDSTSGSANGTRAKKNYIPPTKRR